MGVSLHYRGRLNDTGMLSSLCDEVSDIANSIERPTMTLDDDWAVAPNAALCGSVVHGNLGLKGIQLTPHDNSEPLCLFFDREGFLRSPITMLSILDGTLEKKTAWVSMKTQFAGPDTHIWVTGLLKYVKKRYISNLEVSDESGYWDTGDRQKLESDMALLDGKLERLSSAVSAGRLGDLTGLSADEIASRIERMLMDEEP